MYKIIITNDIKKAKEEFPDANAVVYSPNEVDFGVIDEDFEMSLVYYV